MADLATYMAETSKSYDNSRKALNDQINAISGDLQAQQNRINAQYAQQQKQLENQNNWAAEASSMAASKNGGSFGGSRALVDRKRYQQSFVPAVTQLQTNQANDLSSAESQANERRKSLAQTLASMEDEANRYAIQRYDAAVAAEEQKRQWEAEMAEKQRQFDAQMAQQRAYQNYLNQAGSGSGNTLKSWDFGNGYRLVQDPYGNAQYYQGNNQVSAYNFLTGTGGNNNWDKWNDVWNNGVSTTGVGADTISGINNFLKTGNYTDKYNYLRSM